MIDPQHNCSWTSKHLTEISLADSALLGAGVPLRVLVHALPNRDLVWYSKVYGEFDDNLFLVALNKNTAQSLSYKHLQAHHLTTAMETDTAIEEYVLSPEIESELGIVCTESEYSMCDESSVKYRVHFHDDCFYHIQPVDGELLDSLVLCILQQHSFYLDVEVDWSEALDLVTEIITSYEQITIQSFPKRQQTILVQTKANGRYIHKPMKQQSLARYTIRSNKAELELR